MRPRGGGREETKGRWKGGDAREVWDESLIPTCVDCLAQVRNLQGHLIFEGAGYAASHAGGRLLPVNAGSAVRTASAEGKAAAVVLADRREPGEGLVADAAVHVLLGLLVPRLLEAHAHRGAALLLPGLLGFLHRRKLTEGLCDGGWGVCGGGGGSVCWRCGSA